VLAGCRWPSSLCGCRPLRLRLRRRASVRRRRGIRTGRWTTYVSRSAPQDAVPAPRGVGGWPPASCSWARGSRASPVAVHRPGSKQAPSPACACADTGRRASLVGARACVPDDFPRPLPRAAVALGARARIAHLRRGDIHAQRGPLGFAACSGSKPLVHLSAGWFPLIRNWLRLHCAHPPDFPAAAPATATPCSRPNSPALDCRWRHLHPAISPQERIEMLKQPLLPEFASFPCRARSDADVGWYPTTRRGRAAPARPPTPRQHAPAVPSPALSNNDDLRRTYPAKAKHQRRCPARVALRLDVAIRAVKVNQSRTGGRLRPFVGRPRASG